MDGDHVMALNKNLIEHLMEWKSISAEKIGARHIVSLTDEGINALRFLRDINIVKEV
jgi:predicted transcriptional regulator